MTPQQFKKLKIGDRIYISEAYRDYWQHHAWENCTSKGVLTDEAHAIDWLVRRSISAGLPYTARLKAVNRYAGEDAPGAPVTLQVGPFTDETYLSHIDMEKYKAPIRRKSREQ